MNQLAGGQPVSSILYGDDHVEASAWIGNPLFLLEPPQRCAQCVFRAFINVHRLNLRERITTSGLESFNEGGHGSKHQNILSSISFATTNRNCQFTQTKWMNCLHDVTE